MIESDQIKAGREEVDQLWADLKDLADARSLALVGAKEIHTFDRDAADAKQRVQVSRNGLAIFTCIGIMLIAGSSQNSLLNSAHHIYIDVYRKKTQLSQMIMAKTLQVSKHCRESMKGFR